MRSINAKDLHAKDMAESPQYREAYEALEAEFAVIDQSIRDQRALREPLIRPPGTFSHKGRRG